MARRHAAPAFAGLCALLASAEALAQAPQTSAADAAPSSTPDGAPARAPDFGYDNGFYLRSADGRARFRVGGLFQFDAVHYGARRTPDSEFEVRRMRVELGFSLDEVLHVDLEPNFVPGDVDMEEANVRLELDGGQTRVQLGRAKAPFGLEEVRSRRWIDFAYFSLLNQFTPAEDHGVFVRRRTDDERWQFFVAAYNGTGGAESNSSKDVVGRVSWSPFAQCETSCARSLQFGIAATTGSQDGSAKDHPVHNEIGRDVVLFGPAVRFDGSRERVGVDVLWTHGPWFAQAEWMHMREELEDGGTSADVSFDGAYVDLSYVLTGETRGDGKVQPREAFDLRTSSGSGAWVLAARFSELHLDDDIEVLGFAVPGTFTDTIRSLSLGLNWFANEHVLVRNSWTHSFYSDPVDVGGHSVSDEDSFVVELQVSF
jgi:phosphate-selective porin OprO/OprP